jgi:uncharacterized protein (TIGR02271 family)
MKLEEENEASENPEPDQSAEHIIPVIEEKIKIGKKNVETGKLKIMKKIAEEEVTVEVPAGQEELEVERVTVNQYIEGAAPEIRQENGTTIIPVLREVIEKRLLLTEELHITKRKVQSDAKEKIRLRKEEVSVEYVDLTGSGHSGN